MTTSGKADKKATSKHKKNYYARQKHPDPGTPGGGKRNLYLKARWDQIADADALSVSVVKEIHKHTCINTQIHKHTNRKWSKDPICALVCNKYTNTGDSMISNMTTTKDLTATNPDPKTTDQRTTVQTTTAGSESNDNEPETKDNESRQMHGHEYDSHLWWWCIMSLVGLFIVDW